MAYRNYHTHTPRCKHARGTEEEYILTAIEAGYDELGFSDHSPWPFADGHVSRVRMDPAELDGYVTTLAALREKYRGRLNIRIGLECEAYTEFFPWIKEQKEAFGLDYLILGNHTTDTTEEHFFIHSTDRELMKHYTDMVTAGMESGLFCVLAHPELGMAQYPEFDADAKACARAIAECAKANNVILEYNLQGDYYREQGRMNGLGYPNRDFLEIAGETGCTAIVGVDAHSPEMLTWTDRLESARALLAECGLTVTNTVF